MEQLSPEKIVIRILEDVGKKGALGREVFKHSNLSCKQFYLASKSIWNSAVVVGDISVGCCGDGCGEDCVSYLNQDMAWKIKSALFYE